jgi:hypothetical protein
MPVIGLCKSDTEKGDDDSCINIFYDMFLGNFMISSYCKTC